MNYRICSPDGKECYNHSDDDFNAGRRAGKKDGFTFSGDGKYFEKGDIRDKDGNVIATYEQTSLDEPAHQLAFEMQRQFGSPDLYARVAANLVSGAVISAGFRSIKPVNLPNRKKVSVDMEEVESGHMTGGVRAAQNAAEKAAKRGKDMFPDWTTPDQAKRAILDAYTHSKVVRTQGARVVLQGVTKDGTVVEMWFNRTTNVIETAYPKGRASQ
jgi:Bacterial EndoU nuclease